MKIRLQRDLLDFGKILKINLHFQAVIPLLFENPMLFFLSNRNCFGLFLEFLIKFHLILGNLNSSININIEDILIHVEESLFGAINLIYSKFI